MSLENPKYITYSTIVTQSERHTLLALSQALHSGDATIRLVLVAISAFEAGLSREEIAAALAEGEEQGLQLHHNVQHSGRDVAYWQAIRQEAEEFWESRYNPDAPQDWS